jgi:hypothetical protein
MGIQQMMTAADPALHVQPNIAPWSIYTGAYSSSFSSITFGSDGTITTVCGYATSTGAPAWYTPTGAGVGASYWIRATYSGAHNEDSGLIGVWSQLNVNRTWSVQSSGGGSTGDFAYATLILEIAVDSLGASIISSTYAVLQAETLPIIIS